MTRKVYLPFHYKDMQIHRRQFQSTELGKAGQKTEKRTKMEYI
jgi:hypothetical protein